MTDAAGNTYSELLHFKASDTTEESVWTAPITAGGGTKPAIRSSRARRPTSAQRRRSIPGCRRAPGAAVVDQVAQATGPRPRPATVASGATRGDGCGQRARNRHVRRFGVRRHAHRRLGLHAARQTSPAHPNIDLLTEDQVLASAGATPNATAGAGAKTTWLMATVVLQGASVGRTADGSGRADRRVGDGRRRQRDGDAGRAPGDGGSPITSYTVTPYIGIDRADPDDGHRHPPATSATVNGLTNGTAYTFTVSATNAVGTGPRSTPSDAVTPTRAAGGQWGPLMNWPIVAIHSILLDNGKVLQFDGWQQPEPTQVWDPSTQTVHDADRARQHLLLGRWPSCPTGGCSSSAATAD